MDTKELVKIIKYLEIYTNRKVNEVFVGNYKSSFRGQGLEVSDLRKYEEGDDARHIDWIITARQGSPYVKKFQETRELTTMLIVDISDSMHFTSSEKTKSKVCLETAAYILFSALKNNDKFGAIIFADFVYAYIPPQKGRKHLLYILREIIQGFDMKKIKKTNLNVAFDYFNKTVKKHSICFLLTDNISKLFDKGDRGLRPLKIINNKHDLVYVSIYDEFEKKIDSSYPCMSIINPETGAKEIVDLSNKKLVNKYNRIRYKKYRIEDDILKKNRIDFLAISTTGNIYKSLLLFFRKRALKF